LFGFKIISQQEYDTKQYLLKSYEEKESIKLGVTVQDLKSVIERFKDEEVINKIERHSRYISIDYQDQEFKNSRVVFRCSCLEGNDLKEALPNA
jgi:hypothetical protein